MWFGLFFVCMINSFAFTANDRDGKEKTAAVAFSIDYACFKGNEKQTYIEIYSQVDLSALEVAREGMTYFSEYRMKYVIRDNGKVVKEYDFDDMVNYDSNLDRSSKMRLSVQGILLQPGYYSCEVQLTDRVAQKAASQPIFLDVPDFAVTNFILSDIQIASSIYASDQQSAFVKNGLFVKPNINRLFNYFTGEFFIYYEVYGLTTPDGTADYAADLLCKVKADDGTLKKTVQHSVNHPSADGVHSVRMSILELSRGHYELEVQVRDRNSGQVAINRTDFYIGWSDEYNKKSVVSDLIKQLKYVAPQWNFDSMHELSTEMQRTAILSFWKSRDPSPETLENELMEEFYKRISFANANFRHYEGKGWKSDQGKVYIQNGNPANVYRMSSRSGKDAYEIWKYDKTKRCFIFINRRNFGDFRLLPQGAPEYYELAGY